jgi:hypothetical protein
VIVTPETVVIGIGEVSSSAGHGFPGAGGLAILV